MLLISEPEAAAIYTARYLKEKNPNSVFLKVRASEKSVEGCPLTSLIEERVLCPMRCRWRNSGM
jgi:hypothetical protein